MNQESHQSYSIHQYTVNPDNIVKQQHLLCTKYHDQCAKNTITLINYTITQPQITELTDNLNIE